MIGTIVAVIIEQILRARGDEDNPKDVKNVFVAMGISKLETGRLFNIIWFIGYAILLFVISCPSNA